MSDDADCLVIGIVAKQFPYAAEAHVVPLQRTTPNDVSSFYVIAIAMVDNGMEYLNVQNILENSTSLTTPHINV